MPPEQRSCPNCHLHKVEEEKHLLIECQRYKEDQKSLFESVRTLSIGFNG